MIQNQQEEGIDFTHLPDAPAVPENLVPVAASDAPLRKNPYILGALIILIGLLIVVVFTFNPKPPASTSKPGPDNLPPTPMVVPKQ